MTSGRGKGDQINVQENAFLEHKDTLRGKIAWLMVNKQATLNIMNFTV